MVATPEKSTYYQRSKLGVIMFMVFLACVAGAWWLSDTRSALAKRGAQVLEEIRADGLAKYWGKATAAEFYVARDKSGKPVAWSASVRFPFADRYTIAELQPAFAGGGQLRLDKWNFANDLSNGKYISSGSFLLIFDRTKIEIAVESPQFSGKAPPSELPSNYLPGGLMRLAVRLLAKQKADASFKTVVPETAIAPPGLVNFSVTYVKASIATAVHIQTVAVSRTTSATYELDAGGTVQTIIQDGLAYHLTAPSEAAKLFSKDKNLQTLAAACSTLPDDDSQLRQLLHVPQVALPPTEE